MAYTWEIVEESNAPIERVWEVVTNARGWNTWGRFKVAKLERTGDQHDDGVGSIRVFGNPPMVSREEIVAWEPPHHHAYTLLSGLPIVDYRADVYLQEHGTGTTITWKSSFTRARPALMSGFFVWFLKRFIGDTAKRAARYAETVAAGA